MILLLLLPTILIISIAVVFALSRDRRINDVLPLFLLGILTVGFFWRLLAGDAYAPAGGGDLASFLYPYYVFASQTLRAGQVPLWNPFVFSGMPFVGDVQNGLFYPVNLLVFLSHDTLNYPDIEALSIFHFFVAGAGMYLFLRNLPELKLSIGASLLGALAFMFSDLFVLHFGNLNMIAIAAWLPVIAMLFLLALQRDSVLVAAWSGFTLGMASLAGHIQPTIYNSLFLGGLTLAFSVPSWRRKHIWRCFLRPFFLLFTAGAVAIATSAPATLPAFALSHHTTRASFTYWEASQYSLLPIRLLGFFFPDLTGRDPAVYWGLGDRVETGYVGVLPLLLAIFVTLKLWRVRWVRVFSLLAAASLLLALGNTSLLHGWLYQVMPGFDLLRAPARAVYLTDFCICVLAAIAVEGAVNRTRPRFATLLSRFASMLGRYVLPLLSVFLMIGFLAILLMQDRDPVIFSRAWTAANSISRTALIMSFATLLLKVAPSHLQQPERTRQWLLAALAFTYIDLASVGAYLDLGRTDPTASLRHDEAVAFLKSDPTAFRVDVLPTADSDWQPNLGCLYQIEHVRGVANPMELERYRLFLERFGSPDSPAYLLLGAKYLVVPKGQELPSERYAPVFNQDPYVDIYLDQKAKPYVSLVHEAITVKSSEDALALLDSPEIDTSITAVIEGEIAPLSPAFGPENLWFSAKSTNSLSLQAELSAPGLLRLAIPFSPGWQATVDGQRMPILHSDLAFMAVYLPSGSHSITFSFKPPLLALSVFLSLGTSLSLTILTFVSLLRRKGISKEKPTLC